MKRKCVAGGGGSGADGAKRTKTSGEDERETARGRLGTTSDFEIMAVGTSTSTSSSRGSRTLQSLVSGNIRTAFVSNYMVDPVFTMDFFPQLASCGELIIAHGLGPEEHVQIKSVVSRYRSADPNAKHLLVHRPPLPIAFGTHHTKMFVLIYDNKLRVVIHTGKSILLIAMFSLLAWQPNPK